MLDSALNTHVVTLKENNGKVYLKQGQCPDCKARKRRILIR